MKSSISISKKMPSINGAAANGRLFSPWKEVSSTNRNGNSLLAVPLGEAPATNGATANDSSHASDSVSVFRAQKRIFLVDAHPVYASGLEELINQNSGLKVCGRAGNAAEALGAITGDRPDLVILELSIPGRDGLELIKNIHAVCPELLMLAISMHGESLYAERVLRAGGRGYVMKHESHETILKAIRRVLDGGVYLSEKMSARVLGLLSGASSGLKTPVGGLTDRELEVLRLTGLGREPRAIAGEMNLSVKTVDTHRTHIKKKLHLKSSTELVCYAVRCAEPHTVAG